MIILKSEREIAIIREACKIVRRALDEVKSIIEPGISTYDIEKLAVDVIKSYGGKPAFKGYMGYPGFICVSLNEEVVHGIPSPKRKLKKGDIVSIDIGVYYKGYYGDGAWTFPVSEIDEDLKTLLKAGQECLNLAISKFRLSNKIYDVSHSIESCAAKYGYSVVKDYTGHGIGKSLHEKPEVPNYGEPGRGPLIENGMVVAIEPMVNMGSERVKLKKDKWTVVTSDGKPSVHFEHTVAILNGNTEVLTV